MPIRTKRTVKNLYLPGIHFPVGSVVSVLHRISGVLLVLSLPFTLWLLQASLTDNEGYSRVLAILGTLPVRLLLLGLCVLLAHHLFAGLRHLLQDVEIGISRQGGRQGAWFVLVTVMLSLFVSAAWLFR